MSKVRVTIPASTTNLGCGFDCLGLALTLYNIVEMEFIEKEGVFIQVEGEGEGLIPTDAHNIIFSAAKMVFDHAGKEFSRIKIKEINRIPLCRGLGSSAATRIGGIVAASRLLNLNLPKKEILRMAVKLEGHPDNATASVVGGFVAVVEGEEGPIWVKLSVPESLRVVVIVPELKILTVKAREVLPSTVTFADALFNLARVALLVPSLNKGMWDNLVLGTQDKLHQPYRSSLLPGMEEVFQAALDAGAKGVFLSGAGSGIAAFASGKENEIGKAMQGVFLRKGIRSKIMILSVDEEGTRVYEEK